MITDFWEEFLRRHLSNQRVPDSGEPRQGCIVNWRRTWITLLRLVLFCMASSPGFAQATVRITVQAAGVPVPVPVAGASVHVDNVTIQTDAAGIAVVPVSRGRSKVRVT